MQIYFNSFISSVLDLLFPLRKTEDAVRKLSLDDLFQIATPEGPLPYRDDRVTSLVWELKYRRNPRAAALAGEYLSDMLMAEAAEFLGKPLLIPMPMHAARRKERGYNQTEVLCEAAMEFLKDSFEYAPDIVTRIQNTVPQQGLERHKRLSNVKNSMHVNNPARVRGRVCMVVDDVSTTGATGQEARRVLQTCVCQAVRIVALARS